MSTRAPAHIYVYYRVVSDSAATRAAIDALLAKVEIATGVAGHLLARCDDPAMWMEIYEPIDDITAFSRTLDALAIRHEVAAIAVDRRRHTECFAPLPPIGYAGPLSARHAAR